MVFSSISRSGCRVAACLVVAAAALLAVMQVARSQQQGNRPGPAGFPNQPNSRRPGPPPAKPPAPRILYPTPSLKVATARYEAEFPDPAVSRVLALLEQPLPPGGCHLKEEPVRNLSDWINEHYQITVFIDVGALEEYGFDDSTPITLARTEGSLGDALSQGLGVLDLAVVAEKGALVITTREQEENVPLIGLYPRPLGISDMRQLIELIQGTLAPETWDILGGQASIRPLEDRGLLAITQNLSLHREILALMQSLDAFGEPVDEGGAAAATLKPAAITVHELRHPPMAEEILSRVPELCDAALGPRGDPEARLTVVAGRVVVQSASRPFHVYAGELLRSLDGITAAPGGFEGLMFR